jgi:hypothetical protein
MGRYMIINICGAKNERKKKKKKGWVGVKFVPVVFGV